MWSRQHCLHRRLVPLIPSDVPPAQYHPRFYCFAIVDGFDLILHFTPPLFFCPLSNYALRPLDFISDDASPSICFLISTFQVAGACTPVASAGRRAVGNCVYFSLLEWFCFPSLECFLVNDPDVNTLMEIHPPTYYQDRKSVV